MFVTAIKALIQRKRIIKLRGKYIPQMLCGITWCGMSRRDTDFWSEADKQMEYCSYDSLDGANVGLYAFLGRVKKEKQRKKEQTRKEIYIPEPEMWVKLKEKEEQ